MIRHHPSPEILAEYAAGSLRAGEALVIACHLERCAACRRDVAVWESVGGFMLERLEPAELAPAALTKALAQLDEKHESPTVPKADFLDEWDVPEALRRHRIGPRRRLSPQVWFAPVMTGDTAERSYLVFAEKGVVLPRHHHVGRELTAVLAGGYRDEIGSFSAGDFIAVEAEARHAPSVDPTEACLCLVTSEGPMRLEGTAARIIQWVFGRQY